MLILGSVSKTARSRSTCKTKSSIHFICTLSNIYLPSSFRNWIFSQHYPLQGVKAGFSLNIYLLINKSPDKIMLYLVFNTYPAMFNARRSQSNLIELQSFKWLRLGTVIELNWTHPTMLPIKHNRTLGNQTLKQSNIIIKHCMQQSNIKPVSSGFKQKALCSNKLRLHFQTQVHKDVTELMRDPGNEVGHRGRKTQTSFWKWWLKATMSARFHCQCLWKVYF